MGLVMQNGDFDSNAILEKNRDFDLDLKNRYSTSFAILPVLQRFGDAYEK